ncbi:MAG TPA: TonB-dependent receptor [Chryseolinea sp.]|nr:TonB-dependent receptor [Chryseolinea sp.]HPH45733.1 TonB-dependent receptor [Chryseolinea sp.]HPM29012.1 TonB-dependent receptor [Chryseolinea sp.]
MKNLSLTFFACLLFITSINAQELLIDSTKQLDEVVISAYQYNRPISEVPLAIGLVGEKELQRFGASSFVPVINSIPGVRMEERSPGSYRLSIRGSTLRSPFGVRNVKVYWNDLPFTDPGGNTYLNLLDFSSLQQIEIAKGPGASLYGAGTGGVMLMKNSALKKNSVEASAIAGSFGLFRYSLQGNAHSDGADIRLMYAHQQADGYRDQTKMTRDVLQGEINFDGSKKSAIAVNFLYADLFYQTPGGLTKAQYDTLPTQARLTPSAIDKKAAVYNKTFYTGFNHTYDWNEKWSTKTGLYGSFTQFENPTTRNYERRAEQGLGGRTNTSYQFAKGKLNFGAEYQHGFSPIKVYANNQGQPGAFQNDDELSTTSYFIFAQSEFYLPRQFFLTLGASVNKSDVKFTRLSDVPNVNDERNFDAVFSPRIALLKKLNTNFSVYGTFSQGYSPPTLEELYPSNVVFNQQLNPEKGNNIEFGFRGNLLNNQLTFDVAAYDFNLKETIVIRREADGAEYFVNAGSTIQKGLEIQLAWMPQLAENSLLSNFKLWTGITLNDYQFKDYTKDTISYAGNGLTGVAPGIYVAGLDLSFRFGVYTNITFNHTAAIPLDDANTDYANAYNLLGGRLGYRKTWNKFSLDLFVGVDNALDEKYSLGNDLNAIGKRYYNAAPTINYYSGVRIGFAK